MDLLRGEQCRKLATDYPDKYSNGLKVLYGWNFEMNKPYDNRVNSLL